jgi:hypothetical protein
MESRCGDQRAGDPSDSSFPKGSSIPGAHPKTILIMSETGMNSFVNIKLETVDAARNLDYASMTPLLIWSEYELGC